jgi:hypothetical protein
LVCARFESILPDRLDATVLQLNDSRAQFFVLYAGDRADNVHILWVAVSIDGDPDNTASVDFLLSQFF